MITAKGQYKTISIDSEIKIDGGIMPRRIKKDQLRGEDICYLAEKMNRLLKLQGIYYTGQTVGSVDKRIIGSRFQCVIDWLKYSETFPDSSAGKFIVDNASFKPSYHSDTQSFKAPCELDQDVALVHSVQSNRDDFNTGKPVKKDPINTLLDDMKPRVKLQGTFYQYGGWKGFQYLTIANDPGGDIPERRKPSAPYAFSLECEEIYDSKKEEYKWVWKKWTLNNGQSNKYQIDKDIIKYMSPYATLFVQIVTEKSFFTDKDHYYTDTNHNVDIFPVTVFGKQQDGYLLYYADYLSILEQVKTKYRLANTDTPNPAGHSQDGSAGVFRAKIWFNDLAWGVFRLNEEMDY